MSHAWEYISLWIELIKMSDIGEVKLKTKRSRYDVTYCLVTTQPAMLTSCRHSSFPKICHCGRTARIVLEQNKLSQKITSNRDWTWDPKTVVVTSCVHSLVPFLYWWWDTTAWCMGFQQKGPIQNSRFWQHHQFSFFKFLFLRTKILLITVNGWIVSQIYKYYTYLSTYSESHYKVQKIRILGYLVPPSPPYYSQERTPHPLIAGSGTNTTPIRECNQNSATTALNFRKYRCIKIYFVPQYSIFQNE